MSEERIDPETLAAFLDGTASPEERDGVLRTLARSKEAYASFLEASAIQRELAAEAPVVAPALSPVAPAEASRPSAREAANTRWFRSWKLAPVLLAAGIAGILIVRGMDRGPASGAIQLAQATSLTSERGSGAIERTLGSTWDQPPWSIVRGSEPAVDRRPLAFRAGVRYAELELAARAADSAAVTRSVDVLAQLLATTEGGGPFAATFRDLATEPEFGSASRRAAAAGQLRSLLGSEDWFDLGVWAETARLAIAARDTAFFDPRGRGVSELRRIIEPHTAAAAPESAEWVPVTDALRPLLEGRAASPNDLADAGRAVDAAIAVAAR